MPETRKLAAILAGDVVCYDRLAGADEERTLAVAIARCRWAIEANRNYPNPHFLLGPALAQLGRQDEAHSAVKASLALSPAFCISRRAPRTAMSDNSTYLAQDERALEALRKAGVPEQ